MLLGLGTAQFGLDYGISNRHGRLQAESIRDILERAKACGVDLLDTAPAYGNAEIAIGAEPAARQGFRVLTKTARFRGAPIDDDRISEFERTFERSLARLDRDSVYGLLVHSCDDLFAPGGERLIASLEAIRQRGHARKIGASVYRASQIDRLLDRFPVDIVQLPLNVLDQRLVLSGHLTALKRAGIEIHARSVFLQGLLLMAPAELPESLAPLRPALEELARTAAAAGTTPVRLALSFIRRTSEIDACIVGVTSPGELTEIVTCFNRSGDADVDFSALAVDDETLVDPSRWRQVRTD